MKRLAASTSVLWLVHAVHADAACKTDALPYVAPLGDLCREKNPHVDTEFIGDGIPLLIQQCVLVRSVSNVDIKRARNSIQESNCFLDAVLRPEVKAVIKRGAQSYLAKSRSERQSPGTLFYDLEDALGEAETFDLSGLVYHFVDTTYRFQGLVDHPRYGLEQDARRHGIYERNALDSLVLYEYASHLTENNGLGAEARSYLALLNRTIAPPDGYTAKGCRKSIKYSWHTMSLPVDSFDDLSLEPAGNQPQVHWGVCPDDKSIWVYYYEYGWKKASISDAAYACERFKDRSPVASACKKSQ